jgi:hypothetical protein
MTNSEIEKMLSSVGLHVKIPDADALNLLRAKVAELQAENAVLRRQTVRVPMLSAAQMDWADNRKPLTATMLPGRVEWVPDGQPVANNASPRTIRVKMDPKDIVDRNILVSSKERMDEANPIADRLTDVIKDLTNHRVDPAGRKALGDALDIANKGPKPAPRFVTTDGARGIRMPHSLGG